MSRSGSKSGDGKRAVTPDEAELWDHATRALAPIKAKPRVKEAAQSALEAPVGPRPPPKAVKPAAPVAPSRELRALARTAPPLADLERRKVRKIAAGKLEIEATVDLHGLRQGDAVQRLRTFLLDAHARGLRTVLVITGKGGEQGRSDHMTGILGEQRRGVLRRSVPQWLAEPALRAIVLGYTTAGPRHGGGGAFYVQLRKGGRG